MYSPTGSLELFDDRVCCEEESCCWFRKSLLLFISRKLFLILWVVL